ncbi:MAG: ATP-binding protein [Actinomycetota bacterium]
MDASVPQLQVRSHVARDLLQSAAFFKTDKAAVWEYVSNGLQYVDSGTSPVVKVRLDSKGKKIAVQDNGRGMDWAGLQNFFVMHGENVDRKSGAAGRGRFGTGKSAAFGIADTLRITTVQGGLRNKVELDRSDIDAMASEDPIPVRIIEHEIDTTESNGTLIEIEGVRLRSIEQAGVIRFLEKHLAQWRKDAKVLVNHHECECTEPPTAEVRTFSPDEETRKVIGDVTLTIKVSKAPLEEELRGVSIFSKEVWHETTLAGCEGREMANHLFGEIDVPLLDSDTSTPAAFDMSRSMKLNRENPLVFAVDAFVGQKLDEVRRELVEADKERRRSEEAKRLQEQASEIARVLNEDFEDYRRRLAKVKAIAGSGPDFQPGAPEIEAGDDFLVPGDEVAAVESYPPKSDEPVDEPRKPPELDRESDGDIKAKPVKAKNSGAKRPRGGFSVKFGNLGDESPRAKYEGDERTIFINLDHPQIVAARGLGTTEDVQFRRLSYEVAFTEYAIALAYELALRGEFMDFDEPVGEVRDTINRLAARGAVLYEE